MSNRCFEIVFGPLHSQESSPASSAVRLGRQRTHHIVFPSPAAPGGPWSVHHLQNFSLLRLLEQHSAPTPTDRPPRVPTPIAPRP